MDVDYEERICRPLYDSYKLLLFDDSLNWQPDASVLPCIKFVAVVFYYLRPNAQCFNSSSFWASVDRFEPFGMPLQKGPYVAG